MTRLCFDIDCIIFDAVSVAEERYITATHTPTGKVLEFENKTELWGDWRKKEGGWIATQNKLSGNDYYKAADFEVVECQRPRPFKIKGNAEEGIPDSYLSPFDGAKKILDDKIIAICAQLKTNNYFGYTGKGDVFRHDIATLLPYKGQREDMLRPLLLDQMKDYVVKHHNITLVDGIEADDAVSMATVAGWETWYRGGKQDKDKVIAIAVDKDAKQTSGWHFNPTKDKEPRLIEGFGSLWLNDKGDVDGAGRMWLYYQMAVGDSTDNYKANCFSKVKYASKGGYADLKDCTNDKEAFTALVGVFKKLYPEKIKVTTFRGELEIDWLYVLQEMADMAMMQRKPNDRMNVKSVLTKLGIEHE